MAKWGLINNLLNPRNRGGAEMNKTITGFLEQQTCATICCINEDDVPYCFNCYYVFEPACGLIYFKSSEKAYHAALLENNPAVAGTILPDKLNKLATKGIQWQGYIQEAPHPLTLDAAEAYHHKIPMARAIKGKVYTIRLNALKMTDSQLGFGRKHIWRREE
ncbi:pyridoxamine 5'-phosphate oxidase family protein [Chitinophaga sp. HK235]|uniref:pyridoxamine 5'-phosphate oxidase family protein n=1 Tax=Chitinophaga sp. HK235 TaxID=2952571 RepID=UPI001BA7B76E|nr:pyridoxamine 5'-phosphate oxidase family protein [Chitinophaga sp. HK235]